LPRPFARLGYVSSGDPAAMRGPHGQALFLPGLLSPNNAR